MAQKKPLNCRPWKAPWHLFKRVMPWNWMNSGVLCCAARINGGSGWLCADARAKWWLLSLAVAAGEPVRSCGKQFRSLTGRRIALLTFGKLTRVSLRPSNSHKTSPKRKPTMWNASTASCAKDWGAWCVKPSPSPSQMSCIMPPLLSSFTATIARRSPPEPLPF